jgi:hypothetical protein
MVSFIADSTGQRRFRLSIRALMIAVAFCALLLVPLVWTFRQAEALRRERLLAEQARYQALLARDLAQVRSPQAAAKLGITERSKVGALWAGLSVNHPTFIAGQTKDLRIEFALVNDGYKVIDPKIADSRIIINGKELTDSGAILSSIQKGARSQALSPGESLQFDCLLGDHFREPGIYRVYWKSSGIQSSEIVLRILPKEAH